MNCINLHNFDDVKGVFKSYYIFYYFVQKLDIRPSVSAITPPLPSDESLTGSTHLTAI